LRQERQEPLKEKESELSKLGEKPSFFFKNTIFLTLTIQIYFNPLQSNWEKD